MTKTDIWQTRPLVREGAPKNDKIVTFKKKISGQKSHIWVWHQDIGYWLTDRQSQCDFDFDFEDMLQFPSVLCLLSKSPFESLHPSVILTFAYWRYKSTADKSNKLCRIYTAHRYNTTFLVPYFLIFGLYGLDPSASSDSNVICESRNV
jgi:hypothetical protein